MEEEVKKQGSAAGTFRAMKLIVDMMNRENVFILDGLAAFQILLKVADDFAGKDIASQEEFLADALKSGEVH